MHTPSSFPAPLAQKYLPVPSFIALIAHHDFALQLLLASLPNEVRGKVIIHRNGEVVWQAQFLAGENHMTQSVENLEHAHFKHQLFRRPGLPFFAPPQSSSS